ncbi:MAG: FecR domain-containing protein [Methylophilaceae bacterium]|jgi:transmembrane sensor
MDTRISPDILDEAADWLMRLNAGLSERERDELNRWRNRSAAHAQAWQKAERLLHKLDGLPPQISMPVLNRPSDPKRRAALKHLLVVLGSVPLGWAAFEISEKQGWVADFRTAKGEWREFRLTDGSHITLNTDTAVDTYFDEQRRLIVLRRGEILIETAKDAYTPARAFMIETDEGRLQALGTRFDVRRDNEGRTLIAVFEGAVRVTPNSGEAVTLDAGEQCIMTPTGVIDRKTADLAAAAWTQGMLVADGMRLRDFAQEMTRYRKGLLRVDPAVADLKISGAYPLDKPEHVMTMLSSTYPVEAKAAMLGYVITLVPRQ